MQRRRVRQPPPPSDAAPYDGFVVHPTGYGVHGTPCGARRPAGRRVGHLPPFLAEGASDGGSGMPGGRPCAAWLSFPTPMYWSPRNSATRPRKLVAPPPTPADTSAGIRKTSSSVAAPSRNCRKPVSPLAFFIRPTPKLR